MCTALSATVGTGNIAGVSGAIAIGGPGAVFWMWVSALLGMCTKFCEVTLAVHSTYRNWVSIFTAAMFCFAVSTIIVWGLYGARCAVFLLSGTVFRLVKENI